LSAAGFLVDREDSAPPAYQSQADPSIATWYAAPQDLRVMLGGLDEYTDDELARYIMMAEYAVDNLANTCFAGKACMTNGYEWHSLTKFRGGLIFGTGIPVFLKHAPVKSFKAIEVFDGVSWQDLLKTGVEARNTGDWWCEYENGVLYINLLWFAQGGSELRVKYTFGRGDLPPSIRELTLLYAARYMITLDARREVVIEGGGFTSARDMLSFLNTRIKELEQFWRAFKYPAGTYP